MAFQYRAVFSIYVVLFGVVAFCLFSVPAHSQERDYKVYVHSLTALTSGDQILRLWGIQSVNDEKSVYALKGRIALDEFVQRKTVSCVVKDSNTEALVAQCSNFEQKDLSLFLLQEGYVSVERSAVYGTLYEAAYLEAEKQAREASLGIWGNSSASSTSRNIDQNSNFILATLSLVVIFMVGLAVVLFLMINGFRRVLDLQNKALNLRGKDQALRHKEKSIIAIMIYSEINENKEKIGAYLTIHEDMLKNFESSGHQKLGDIVQKQPVLSRSVFDGNTGKLEVFGERLASEIIHYYARIKSKPDYLEVQPDSSSAEIISAIRTAVDNASKLEILSNVLLESFEQHALIKKTHS